MVSLRIAFIYLFIILHAGAYACDSTDASNDPSNNLKVTDARFSYERIGKNSAPVLTAIGTITNTSSKCVIEGIVVQARFFDSSGKEIDVTSENLYDVSLWPSKSRAFRIQASPALGKEHYASVTIGPVSARLDFLLNSRAAKSATYRELTWFERYGSLLRLILVVFLLLALITWAVRKNGALLSQRIEEQNDFLRRQTEVMEKMLAVRQTESKESKNERSDS